MNLHQAKCHFRIVCNICTSLQNYIFIIFWCYCLTFEQHKLYTSKFLFSFQYLQPGIVAFLQHVILMNYTLYGLLLHSSLQFILYYYPIIVAFLAHIFFEIYQPISNIIVESYFKLFYTIFVLTNKFAIWVDIQLKCNNIVYFKIYHLQFAVIVYGLINDHSSIHSFTQILLEISNSCMPCSECPTPNNCMSQSEFSTLYRCAQFHIQTLIQVEYLEQNILLYGVGHLE